MAKCVNIVHELVSSFYQMKCHDVAVQFKKYICLQKATINISELKQNYPYCQNILVALGWATRT